MFGIWWLLGVFSFTSLEVLLTRSLRRSQSRSRKPFLHSIGLCPHSAAAHWAVCGWYALLAIHLGWGHNLGECSSPRRAPRAASMAIEHLANLIKISLHNTRKSHAYTRTPEIQFVAPHPQMGVPLASLSALMPWRLDFIKKPNMHNYYATPTTWQSWVHDP